MVTQAEIAKKLGVSRQLVSFALSGNTRMVGKENMERILAAAEELGYQPNPFARALQSGRTGIIGLWVPNLISNYFSKVARELGRIIKPSGYEMIISEVAGGDMGSILSHVPVDAVCVVDIPKVIETQQKLFKNQKIPVVSVGTYYHPQTDHVRVDLETGVAELMDHFLQQGCRRILHVTNVRETLPQEHRRRVYEKAMLEAGLTTEYLYYPSPQPVNMNDVVRNLMQNYLRVQKTPDAVFCHSDDVALGVFRGLRDVGLRVPQDVVIAGCDNADYAPYLDCPLSTIEQPVGELCLNAWHFLLQRLTQPDLPQQKMELKARLLIRDSSCRPLQP